jgi:hypothetical protein
MKDLGSYFQRILTNASRAAMRKGVNSEISKAESIRNGIKRIPGNSETNNPDGAKAPNHHYIFCSHEVPYWRVCTKCGRDKELASRNAQLVLKHCGAAIPFFMK